MVFFSTSTSRTQSWIAGSRISSPIHTIYNINIISAGLHHILRSTPKFLPILQKYFHSDQIRHIIFILAKLLCLFTWDPKLTAFVHFNIIDIINAFKLQDRKILKKLSHSEYSVCEALFLYPEAHIQYQENALRHPLSEKLLLHHGRHAVVVITPTFNKSSIFAPFQSKNRSHGIHSSCLFFIAEYLQSLFCCFLKKPLSQQYGLPWQFCPVFR